MFSFDTNMFASSCFAVHYSMRPLNSLFGSVRGMDWSVHFQFQGQFSLFSDESSAERDALIFVEDQRTLRSILITAALEDNMVVFRKPVFIFGDAAPNANQQLLTREDQWIFTIGGEKYYLPMSKHYFPLLFFRSVTTTRKMDWPVSRTTHTVHVGILTSQGCSRSGPPRHVISLHPGHVIRDVPVGESLAMARTFLNLFVKAEGNYPAKHFRTPGWVHSSKKQWWSHLILYILEHFSGDLKKSGLYEAIRATCYKWKLACQTFMPS